MEIDPLGTNKIISINGVSFELPVPPETEVEGIFSPFKPAEAVRTVQTATIVQEVMEITPVAFLKCNYVTGLDDGRAEVVKMRTGWTSEKRYSLVIIDPAAVGVDLMSFDAQNRAEYDLAAIVREKTGEYMTPLWRIEVVEELPARGSMPESDAQNAEVYWNDTEIHNSVLLKTRTQRSEVGDQIDYYVYATKRGWGGC